MLLSVLDKVAAGMGVMSPSVALAVVDMAVVEVVEVQTASMAREINRYMERKKGRSQRAGDAKDVQFRRQRPLYAVRRPISNAVFCVLERRGSVSLC